MRTWRLINDIPRSGSFNMAADQLLLEKCLDDVEPVYTTFEGWLTTTTGIETFEDLPDKTKISINFQSARQQQNG